MKTTGVRPEALARSISSVSVRLVVLAIWNPLAICGDLSKDRNPANRRSAGRKLPKGSGLPSGSSAQTASAGDLRALQTGDGKDLVLTQGVFFQKGLCERLEPGAVLRQQPRRFGQTLIGDPLDLEVDFASGLLAVRPDHREPTALAV